jgi:hypothetical protein
MTPDSVNGAYEAFGGFFILLSVLKVLKDKQVRGISWVHAGFFTSWGYWNLFFYPSQGLWWSFWGGIGVVAMNTCWMGLLVYYSYFYKGAEG